MKKGDRRQIVEIKDKVTGKVISKKQVVHKNNFSGVNGWIASWDSLNKAPKSNSKRQKKLQKEKESLLKK